ncbi:MAG: oligosaccharide flippase family protein [Thermodesulfobacteriota bacterium]|nr:oligosaccharide flippase family protein [Thermodesulfobacteriota bacterium]
MNKTLTRKSALTGGLQSVVQTLLIFFTIPVFIKLLGPESYGIFGLIATVGNLNIFTNLGLSMTLVKHLSEQGKGKESDYDITVSVLLLTILLLSVCGILTAFNKPILLNMMSIPPAKYIVSKWLFLSVIWGNSLLVLGQLFKAILDASGKNYVVNYLQMLYGFLYWGFIIAVLLLGGDLHEVGIAIFSAALMWFLLMTYNALSTWGIPAVEGLASEFRRIAGKQLHYGGKIFLGSLASFLHIPLLKILIANFIGIQEVGYFHIGIRVRNQLWGIVTRIVYPLLPYIAQINDQKRTGKIIQDVEQNLLYIIFPFIILFCFTIKPFVNLWIGSDTLIIAQSVGVIVSAFLIGRTILPFYYYLILKDHPEKTILLHLGNAAVTMLLFGLTLNLAGYYAALIGCTGGVMTSFFFSLYFQNKYLKQQMISYGNLVKLLFVSVVNAIACYLIYVFIPGDLLKLIVLPVVVIFTTSFLYSRMHFFAPEDITRYFGHTNIISKYLNLLLCRRKTTMPRQ